MNKRPIVPAEACIMRLCRTCGDPMDQTDYQWDYRMRFQYFHCPKCGTNVVLFQSTYHRLNRRLHKDQCKNNEPLSPNEQQELWENDRMERLSKYDCYKEPETEDEEKFK